MRRGGRRETTRREASPPEGNGAELDPSSGNRERWASSDDGDPLGEAVEGQELKRSVKSELLGVARRNLAAHHDLPLDFLDNKIADAAMRELTNLAFNAFDKSGHNDQGFSAHDPVDLRVNIRNKKRMTSRQR